MKTPEEIKLGPGALFIGAEPKKEKLIGFTPKKDVRHRQECRGCGRKNVNTYGAGYVFLCRRCWEGESDENT